jgi:DNA-binding NtrC family response regulator
MPPAGLAPLPGDRDLDAATEALVGLTLAQIERRVIEATIRNCGGSLPRAAQVLGVSPSTLYRKRSAWRD